MKKSVNMKGIFNGIANLVKKIGQCYTSSDFFQKTGPVSKTGPVYTTTGLAPPKIGDLAEKSEQFKRAMEEIERVKEGKVRYDVNV